MMVDPNKPPPPLQYSTLPTPSRAPLPVKYTVFMLGIYLLFAPPLIFLVYPFGLTLRRLVWPDTPLAEGALVESTRLVLLAGLMVLFVSILRWAHRRVRNRELDH